MAKEKNVILQIRLLQNNDVKVRRPEAQMSEGDKVLIELSMPPGFADRIMASESHRLQITEGFGF